MSQFDVYRFATPGAGLALVVDLQNELLDGLATRLVAPLYPLQDPGRPIARLNPVCRIEGNDHFLAVQEMATLRVKSLGKKVASVEERRAEIIAAIDFLITGV
jgi:toxin CcdB